MRLLAPERIGWADALISSSLLSSNEKSACFSAKFDGEGEKPSPASSAGRRVTVTGRRSLRLARSDFCIVSSDFWNCCQGAVISSTESRHTQPSASS